MSQFRGLLMKDWTIIKGYVWVALLLDVLIPVGSAMLFDVGFFEGLLVISGTVMALHLLVPIILLSILFTKEMDRPDIFFHSSASIHKINGSKFLVSIFASAVSLAWISALTFVFLLFAPNLEEAKNLLPSGAMFAVGVLLFSVQLTVVYYFFLTLFFSIKPKIGGFAYIVTFGLFFFSIEMWDRFKATEFFGAVAGFWNITVSDSQLLSELARGFMVTFDNSLTLHIGQFLFTTVLLIALYFISAYWFEKKVRA